MKQTMTTKVTREISVKIPKQRLINILQDLGCVVTDEATLTVTGYSYEPEVTVVWSVDEKITEQDIPLSTE